MSDTRAAIRELRSLSEKRSQSALSEPEAARWTALRRQLGLPPEPPHLESHAMPSAVGAVQSPSAALESPGSPKDAGPADTPPSGRAPGSLPLQEPPGALPPAEVAPDKETWVGPALDRPTAATASSWVGPALDAPAWSDAAAERPTDPGLDEPPPAPFDEAPAARPQPEARAVELGGAPDEPVQLAAAVEFISYAREGSEAIELPADVGSAHSVEGRGLAELAGAAAPAAESNDDGASAWAAPEPQLEAPPEAQLAEGTIPLAPAPLPPEATAAEALADDGGPSPAPLPLEVLAAPADEGAIPLILRSALSR